MLMTLPLFSTRSVSFVAKIALTGYMAFIILPTAYPSGGYENLVSIYDTFNLKFILLLVGEGLIGIIIGFYISIRA